MKPLDRIDARLLNLVQRDNRASSERLAQAVNLSPTAVQRRLKRLRADGVIEADVAIVDPARVGRDLSMLVLVSMDRENAQIVDHIKRAIRAAPEVLNGWFVTGEADFVLNIAVADMAHYERFQREFLYANAQVRNLRTLVVIDRVKTGGALALEAHNFLGPILDRSQ